MSVTAMTKSLSRANKAALESVMAEGIDGAWVALQDGNLQSSKQGL